VPYAFTLLGGTFGGSSNKGSAAALRRKLLGWPLTSVGGPKQASQERWTAAHSSLSQLFTLPETIPSPPFLVPYRWLVFKKLSAFCQ